MRMSQALGNDLSNALLCTQAGGKILLRAGLESDEALAISITDDGTGIDPADLPHIFDPFYRTDQSRSRGVGGTGLGLAITRAIVKAHGGHNHRKKRRAWTGSRRDVSPSPDQVSTIRLGQDLHRKNS